MFIFIDDDTSNYVALFYFEKIKIIDTRRISCLNGKNLISSKSFLPDEVQYLQIHKTYSLTNCLFECAFSSARSLMVAMNHSCTPWFFPSIDEDIR